jgi:hypothetical protein
MDCRIHAFSLSENGCIHPGMVTGIEAVIVVFNAGRAA